LKWIEHMRILTVTETPDHHQAQPRIERESTNFKRRFIEFLSIVGWKCSHSLLLAKTGHHSHMSHSTTLESFNHPLWFLPNDTALSQTHVIKTDSSQTHARLFIGPAWHVGVLSVLYVNGFITFEASTLYQLKSLPRMACDCSISVNWIIQTIVFPHICCRMGRPRSTFHRLWRSLVHFFQAWIVRLLRFVMGSYANLPPRTRTCPALEALVPPGPAPPPQTARGPGGGMLLASEASLRPLKL